MSIFAKYPWLQSMAWSAGEPVINGFRIAEVKAIRGLVNWAHLAETVYGEVRGELEARGILLPGFVVWRDGMRSAA